MVLLGGEMDGRWVRRLCCGFIGIGQEGKGEDEHCEYQVGRPEHGCSSVERYSKKSGFRL
jgi:hypothetical protein